MKEKQANSAYLSQHALSSSPLETFPHRKGNSCAGQKIEELLFADRGHVLDNISSFLLKRIAALDLTLWITIYFLDKPDEEMEEAMTDS